MHIIVLVYPQSLSPQADLLRIMNFLVFVCKAETKISSRNILSLSLHDLPFFVSGCLADEVGVIWKHVEGICGNMWKLWKYVEIVEGIC
jgi:hypothetical protein